MSAATWKTPSTSKPYSPQNVGIFYDGHTRLFHATSRASATPPKAKSSRLNLSAPLRQSRAARLQKKMRVVPPLPAPGQRKAERKRIVLSNTNALPIKGLKDLTAKNMANRANAGQVLGFDQPLLDQLRGLEAFRPTQSWKWFNRPATLIRPETVELAEKINLITQEKQRGSFRTIFSGESGTGKSLMLLQAQAMALMNRWIVLSIPEGVFLLLLCNCKLISYSPRFCQQPFVLLSSCKHLAPSLHTTAAPLSSSQAHHYC